MNVGLGPIPTALFCFFLRLFIDGDRMTDPAVREHLQLDSTLEPEFKIQVMPYGSILTELQAVGASLSPKEKVWLSDKASYALTEAVPKVCGSGKETGFSSICSAWSEMVLMRAAASASLPQSMPRAGAEGIQPYWGIEALFNPGDALDGAALPSH